MERRTKLLILIILAAVLLAFGIWYLLKPIIGPSDQPSRLPSEITPSANLPNPQIQPAVIAPPPLPPDLKQLQDLAGNFVSRMGSGSSWEGFKGYEDVMVNATSEYQALLRAERLALQKAHPESGPAFGMATRVIAVDASQAVSGADIAVFIVQTQQAEDAGDPTKPSKVGYKEATVSFEKQSKGYLINKVVWKDIER